MTELQIWSGGIQQTDYNSCTNQPFHLCVFPQQVCAKFGNSGEGVLYESIIPAKVENWQNDFALAAVGDIHWVAMIPARHSVERIGLAVKPGRLIVDPHSGGPFNNSLTLGASVKLVAKQFTYPCTTPDAGSVVALTAPTLPLDVDGAVNPLTTLAAPVWNGIDKVMLIGYEIVSLPTNTTPSGNVFTWDKVNTAIEVYVQYTPFYGPNGLA